MEPVKPTRKTPRYPFVAPAEVIDEGTGAKMTAQVNELSLHGCYLDGGSPLSMRTKVIVRIYSAAELFEAGATVIYSNQTLGMGLVFRDVKPTYLGILRKWLLAAMQDAGERSLAEPGLGAEPTNHGDADPNDSSH
jgi:hypothetical protein